MYEIGALRALEEAVDGLDLNDVWSYVGVSAGSFVAACLANGLTTKQMVRATLRDEPSANPLRPEVFFTPAYREFVRRGVSVPKLVLQSLVELGRQPTRQGVGEVLGVLARAIPVGLFDNEPIREYLHEIFSLEGRTDDFRELRHRLTVVATDLEAGGAIRFGTPGWDEVPISRAVQASTAVPGIYPPVLIEGRQCVDGVLLKTVHASVALEQGAKLLFCVNPIVPLDTRAGAREGRVPKDLLVTSGLPAVVSQSFRTVIHSRLRVGFSRYASRFPDADVILLEPGADEYELFFQMAFSFRSRRRVCERGYDATRRDLLARYDVLAPILASHGLTLREDVLADDTRDVWRSAELEAHRPRTHRHARPPTITASLDAALRKLEHRVRVRS